MNAPMLLKQKKARLLLAVLCLLCAGFASLALKTPTAHASGGGGEVWAINANGWSGYMSWDFRNYPATSDGSSIQDFYIGSIFTADPIVGYKVYQADGSALISFVRLDTQSTSYISYFQVYNGVESADGTTMTGTFQVYTGTVRYNWLQRGRSYAYTPSSTIYSWSATLVQSNQLQEGPGSTWPWALTANGWPGSLVNWNGWAAQDITAGSALSAGSVFGGAMVGLTPFAASCSGSCPMDFIRPLTTDLSELQIYNGTAVGSGTSASTSASGGFVDVVGTSNSLTYSWSATSLS